MVTGDRIKHRKIPMLLGICGIIASSLMFLFINKYYEFLIARALQGFADASVWTLGLALVADTFPLEELGVQVILPNLLSKKIWFTKQTSSKDEQSNVILFSWSCWWCSGWRCTLPTIWIQSAFHFLRSSCWHRFFLATLYG
jgi:MFS family permease